jgi:hypothetical protein
MSYKYFISDACSRAVLKASSMSERVQQWRALAADLVGLVIKHNYNEYPESNKGDAVVCIFKESDVCVWLAVRRDPKYDAVVASDLQSLVPRDLIQTILEFAAQSPIIIVNVESNLNDWVWQICIFGDNAEVQYLIVRCVDQRDGPIRILCNDQRVKPLSKTGRHPVVREQFIAFLQDLYRMFYPSDRNCTPDKVCQLFTKLGIPHSTLEQFRSTLALLPDSALFVNV